MDYQTSEKISQTLIDHQLKIVGQSREWMREHNLDWPDLHTVSKEQASKFKKEAIDIVMDLSGMSRTNALIEVESYMRVNFFKINQSE